MARSLLAATFLAVTLSPFFVQQAIALGQEACITFQSSPGSFAIVGSNRRAAPIYLSPDEWPGVQLAAADFAADIRRVTEARPSLTNVTAVDIGSLRGTTPILIGTLGKSSLIDALVSNTGLDVSGIQGKWESFISRKVDNPFPGVESAYVIIGSDKRGTIFGVYDHSEQIGVSPWYWWADVPTTTRNQLFATPGGCQHGEPTVKYRGIFLNDEQPALQNWAFEKFTNGTGSEHFNSPFNRFFYVRLFELILRMKGNYLWPAMWGSAFNVDDPLNQFLADRYGVVMGTSHHEPMMRGTPNEFGIFSEGKWDYTTNSDNIKKYWVEGVERAKPFESLYTMGMRGFGDLPLSEETNIELLEQVIADQTKIFEDVFGDDVDISEVPQVWTLCECFVFGPDKEVEGYYEKGMRVPDYITLLWADDNWGNIRRYPTPSERSRKGGAGVYYHFDYVGDPRNYKWLTTTQLEKVHEQMSLAVDREATRVWIVNVGDMKPFEREIEYFLNIGWNSTRWTHTNVGDYISAWAQREFDVNAATASSISGIVGNLTRYNARRKPELLNATTFSLINYREADRVLADWDALVAASTRIYNQLGSSFKAAFFQLVHHPVIASANVGHLYVNAGLNNLRASQASQAANAYLERVNNFFDQDWEIEQQYHRLLDGKWNHFMSQTHLGYYYWQQPMANTLVQPPLVRISPRKQALPGPMRITVENSNGAWPGDNRNNCKDGYNCGEATLTLDNYDTIGSKYISISAGGPTQFTYTVAANVSWARISSTRGSVSAAGREPEQRIFLSVSDWSQLAPGRNVAKLTITANAPGQTPSIVSPTFVAIKNAAAPGFSGFVEGAGVISIEAAHATRKSEVEGNAWQELPGLGRTLSGVTPLPRRDEKFAAGSGPTLEYDFFNFNTISGSGNVTVTVLLSPLFNVASDASPLEFGLALDAQAVQTVRPIPPLTKPGDFPPGWGGEFGWVANSITPYVATYNGIEPGAHTLKISAIDSAIVIQKIIIDTGGLLTSYLGPPESIRV
ncbi:hypothetical protein FA15DRAFT_583018 [Coprinopsis marcescibilis]|uniref:Gylcosyl hydrolase 115 C-terminal domain-containing protein n=1 Tax=Coprinopsis marcescibilis TaxID=230819 RepID=A0A5C3L7W7_COPMA|nr:hypothetical protein FA15DRAFT_583018 [Coprinopsis marcescibilis]